jgi:hypothetical protein
LFAAGGQSFVAAVQSFAAAAQGFGYNVSNEFLRMVSSSVRLVRYSLWLSDIFLSKSYYVVRVPGLACTAEDLFEWFGGALHASD